MKFKRSRFVEMLTLFLVFMAGCAIAIGLFGALGMWPAEWMVK